MLVRTLARGFSVRMFSDVPIVLAEQGPRVILRHDLDVSLDRALPVAEIERAQGVRSTYMVMMNPPTPLYAVGDRAGRAMLRRLLTLGHEIGVHFHVRDPQADTPESVESDVAAACRVVEDL